MDTSFDITGNFFRKKVLPAQIYDNDILLNCIIMRGKLIILRNSEVKSG